MGNTHTSAVFEAATDKIRDEMADNAKDAAISVIGEFLTSMLMEKPETAEKIMAEGKSLKGAMAAMSDYARKNKSGNHAAVDYFTGIGIVLEHFGIEKLSNTDIMRIGYRTGAVPDAPAQEPAPKKPSADDLDIDALLGEV